MLGSAFQLGLLSVSVALGSAQPAGPANRPIDTRGLQRIDESFQDVGPLRTSLLQQPVDLRQPIGFDQVYRVPDGAAGERLARISGGLAAVFPRSEYVNTRRGQLVLVPPGTVFYIGSLPTAAPIASRSSPSAVAVPGGGPDTTARPERVTAASTRIGDNSQVFATQPDASRPPPSIMTDEAFRAVRIRHLLQSAAASSQPSR